MLTLLLSIADVIDKKEKITKLYDRYYPLMCYIARENLPNEHYDDTDDIVQEALLDIMEYIDNIDIDDEVRAKSLCLLIVKRRAIDHIRKRDNRNLRLEDTYIKVDAEDQSPEILLDKRATLDIIVNAIGNLDETYREVCRLKYLHQMTEKQIAKLLGLSPKAINMRIMRGKSTLRKTLRKELYGEE